jgi:hypothetical protein
MMRRHPLTNAGGSAKKAVMTERAKKLLLFSAATIFACTGSRAADKAQFEGSTTVELPKPKRTFEESRGIDLKSDQRGPEGGFATPPPAENSPLTNKRLREAIDKQKNWIFLNPYENHYDSKTEQFLKGEKGTGLYDNALMEDDKEKGAVEKFMHERDKRNPDDTRREDRQSGSDRQSMSDRPGDRDSIFKSRDDVDAKNDDGTPLSASRTPFEKAVFSTGAAADPFSKSPLEKNLTRDPFPDDPFGGQKSTLSDFEKDALLEKQSAHEREFSQILQPRPGANFAPAGAMNPAADVGRLDLGGAVQRPDAYSNAGRGGPNLATFSDGGNSAFGSKSEYGSRPGGESFLSEPTRPAPSIAPSLPAPSASPSSVMAPVPFVLPFPQRKF